MQSKSEKHNDLTYPFGMGQAPESGEVFEVAEGVHWLSMPLPLVLDRINLWLLEDGDEWVIVDTGISSPASKTVWNTVADNILKDRRVNKVVVTHMHPDHIGMAGWLTEKFKSDLWMSQKEYTTIQQFIKGVGEKEEALFNEFYIAAGATREELSNTKSRPGGYSRIVSPLPNSYKRLQEDDTIIINDREWHIVTGNGHSPEHVCLHCPSLNLLISGDQVIPRISSNISVWPFEPEQNPLQDWLDSCQRLKKILPDELLVLPAHQEPFYGLHERLSQLIDNHEKTLQQLHDFLSSPKTATDCFPVLFKKEFKGEVNLLAVGESLSHLNYLLHRKVIRRVRKDSVDYYQKV